MTDHKYRFKKPLGEEEHFEAIYEELTLSPLERDFKPRVTVKDYLKAIFDHFAKIDSIRRLEKNAESNDTDLALAILALLSIAFLSNGAIKSNEWEWLDNNRFSIWLWGIAFSAIFLGIVIERTSIFKTLWSYGFTKIVASIALSALVVFSTGKASSIINGVFSVDASALPYTRAIITGLLVFQYSYPLLIVVVLFAIVHAFNAAGWFKKKFLDGGTYQKTPIQSFAFLVLALVILLFSKKWVNTDFSEDVWPKKAYRLAHVLDFNTKHECTNIRSDLSVVFIGPEQARVLVDVSTTQTNDIESFVDARKSNEVHIPKKFYVVACELRHLM
jgi:hypothetical protein